jgi:hypothetical protein
MLECTCGNFYFASAFETRSWLANNRLISSKDSYGIGPISEFYDGKLETWA